jgi:tetratricopeptide (TPR) repeat protein
MHRPAAVLFAVILAPVLFASSPRIAFDRVVPAVHDLGRARDLAIVHAVGDSDASDAFVENFVDQVNHAGFLHARDARDSTGPADAYLAVQTFSCETFNREGEGSVRDPDGNRVKRVQVWVAAVCTARVDVMGRDMKRLSSFYGRGEGTSPRAEELTEDERHAAVRQAARYAAIDAAERITPRRVREHIALDENGPAFDAGMALIEAGRVTEARTHWESELKRNARSAALHFNLAAVCEALGDRKAAKSHYTAASQLAPQEERYASEIRLFSRRQ